MNKVLFVCLGNICRSPSAEGVFAHYVKTAMLENQFEIDSAGTSDWHIGGHPDSRAIVAAAKRQIDISLLRARQTTKKDIEDFDYVIAMDHHNHRDLVRLSTLDNQHKIKLFMDFSANYAEDEVPDPYYGREKGFDQVLDMIEDASQGLLTHIQSI